MAASYPSAVKSFTAIVDGVDYPQATQLNQVYDEVTALQQALLSTGLAHTLKFVDATYDIGATATTFRPRDLFLSRNAAVGGNLSVAATKLLYLDGGGDTYLAEVGGNTVDFVVGGFNPLVRFESNGTTTAKVYMGGAVTNANMTQGLTLQQNAADDQILALKSSDVAHGMTTVCETDTYASFAKAAAVNGGLFVDSLSVANQAFFVRACVTTTDTTRSTAAVGAVQLRAALKSGATVGSMGANVNLAVLTDNGTTRFIFDSDGDSHQDVGTAWTNFDDDDDIMRLDAVAVSLAREGDPLREQFVQSFEQHRGVLEAMPGKPLVQFNEDGHHFVNMSRLTMLLTGAVRQIAREHDRTQRALVSAGVISQAQLEAA